MKILVVQASFLGDTILSTPVIAGVRKLHPDAEIWTLTTPESAEVLKRDPLLAGRIVFDKNGKERSILSLVRKALELRRYRFDRAYVLHRSTRTALLMALSGIPYKIGFKNARMRFLYSKLVARDPLQHDVIRNLRILEPDSEGGVQFDLDLRLTAPEPSELGEGARKIVSRTDPYVMLVPGSAWETKRWHWQRYRESALAIREAGFEVVVCGGPAEADVCANVAEGLDVLNLCGKSSLADLLYLVKRASLVICNDSMAAHVASAFKTPAVVVFCATSPDFGFGPWRGNSVVVEKKDLSCKPCSRHGTHACPLGHERCMRELKAAEVLGAAAKLLPQLTQGRRQQNG